MHYTVVHGLDEFRDLVDRTIERWRKDENEPLPHVRFSGGIPLDLHHEYAISKGVNLGTILPGCTFVLIPSARLSEKLRTKVTSDSQSRSGWLI